MAERYDEFRPSYPTEAIDEVLAYAGAVPGSAALEVGAGTGKATVLFLERGLAVTAIEPSPGMAEVCARNCEGRGVLELRRDEFESAELPESAFELVYCAQAWHWIAPDRRYGLARRALAPGGALAAIWTRVDWEQCPIAGQLQDAYRRAGARLEAHGPMDPLLRSPLDLGDEWAEQIAAAEGLGEARVRRHSWSQRYTASAYASLLSTHSDHVVLAPGLADSLFGEITATIEGHGGILELPYTTMVCLARAA